MKAIKEYRYEIMAMVFFSGAGFVVSYIGLFFWFILCVSGVL